MILGRSRSRSAPSLTASSCCTSEGASKLHLPDFALSIGAHSGGIFMGFTLDARRMAAGMAAALLTALLFWFGTGLHPYWPLTWLAPLPLLLFTMRAAVWPAVFTAALGWFVGMLNLWHFFHAVV